MWLKKESDDQYEIYIPGKKTWTTLEQLHTFLKQFEKRYRLFKPGYYNVLAITNEMGNHFLVEKIEEYVYKEGIDIRILLMKQPFYLKSPRAFVFMDDCYYYQGFFYGKSNQLLKEMWVYEFVEIILEEEYKMVQEKGQLIKKGRDLSSL